jgi:hypothetical protein
MAEARSLFTRGIGSLILLVALLAPAVTRADSNGAPNIAGTWRGKLTSKYWDQTSSASLKPKLKFKTGVTVLIVQTGDNPVLSAVISYDDENFPVADGMSVPSSALSGYVGNAHLNLTDTDPLAIALSGEVKGKNASKIELTGIAGSGDFTHELKITLKRSN